jgi:hypothetical protein
MHLSGHLDPRGSEGAHEKALRPRRGRYGPPGPTVFYYPVQRGDARRLPQRTSEKAVKAKFAEYPSPLKNAQGAVWISDDACPGGVDH